MFRIRASGGRNTEGGAATVVPWQWQSRSGHSQPDSWLVHHQHGGMTVAWQ